MADGNSSIVPATPDEAVTPSGVNHVVINVRDIEESHKFWIEVLGFKQVAYSKPGAARCGFIRATTTGA